MKTMKNYVINNRVIRHKKKPDKFILEEYYISSLSIQKTILYNDDIFPTCLTKACISYNISL